MKTTTHLNHLLLATFIFILGLLVARFFYTGSLHHVFLIWNIFLAWIPYVLSRFFSHYRNKQNWKQVFLFSSWLLFFPNALYIVTDLVHLQDNGNAPLWFDVILLFTSSFIGLIMAFISLHNVEKYLRRFYSRKAVTFIMPLILFLGSFGVYLGRFERWNSWDIIHNPLALGNNILQSVFSPADHIRTWAVTLTLTCLFYIIYRFFRLLPLYAQKNAGQ